MISAIVIDDEQYAREELTELLHEEGGISVIAQAANAIEGLKLINQHKPDAVFLDIQMPKVTGIELLSMLDPDTMPKIIFVTAYDEFAIKAFEDNAFDYLLKPVDPARLAKTLTRLDKEHKKENYAAVTPIRLEQIPCSGHNRILLLSTHDIEFAFSDVSGVHVATKEQQATSQLPLKTLEEKTSLLRCHRQYLINPKSIKEIRLLENNLAEIVTVSHQQVPVSRRYLKVLKETLGFY
ncbi:two-component system response regulator BtsR [Vibrio sp. Of7-15]|uniref:two-component system response regulator BtsR n=1 Tax=Vibrio sp. Of7-15 TaxID=2724879 RepID=UPI001EF170C8|nr:two-component system response regulator BtsR [Vibrio sp. Of7-15]MCG7499844.1 two-component system response regulator BtsR [Vibrio sp. Of7-15]